MKFPGHTNTPQFSPAGASLDKRTQFGFHAQSVLAENISTVASFKRFLKVDRDLQIFSDKSEKELKTFLYWFNPVSLEANRSTIISL